MTLSVMNIPVMNLVMNLLEVGPSRRSSRRSSCRSRSQPSGQPDEDRQWVALYRGRFTLILVASHVGLVYCRDRLRYRGSPLSA